MTEGYCPVCNKNVVLQKEDINIILLIFLCCCCCIGMIIYLIVYLAKSPDRCPFCKTKITLAPIAAMQQQTLYQQQPTYVQQPSANFCPSCGNKVIAGVRYCTNCGREIA